MYLQLYRCMNTKNSIIPEGNFVTHGVWTGNMGEGKYVVLGRRKYGLHCQNYYFKHYISFDKIEVENTTFPSTKR